ncbi:MAG TPA: site-specific integrase [Anaerovoracaceae bacterium]|nr:site-specific integrase [Anaerovoracaceae bacterium]
MQDVKTYGVEKYQVLKSRKQGVELKYVDRWSVRYIFTDNGGNTHDTEKRGFKRERDAKDFERSLMSGNELVAPNKMTMNELFDLWFTDYKSDEDLAENTILWHYYNLLHLRRGLGIKKAQETDLAVLNKFFDELKEPQVKKNGKMKVLSKTSIKNIRRTLKQALDFGVENGYILKNPLQTQKQKRSTKKSIANRVSSFTPTAISQLRIIQMIEAINDPILKLVISLAGLLGLRRGEIRGLLWSDLDLEKKLINVRMQLPSKKYDRDVLKTPSSIRTLRIPDYVVNLLLIVRELQNQAKLKFGEEKFPSDFVLVHCFNKRYIGKPFSSNHFSDSFITELEKHKFQRIRLHDLRHSYGSNLLYQGIAIPTVSYMMGHASVATTLKIYAHVIAELQAADEEEINLKIEETLLRYRSASEDEKSPEISPNNTES